MSNEMPSWRSLASSASRSFKGYVAQRDLKRSIVGIRDNIRPGPSPDGTAKPSWSQWAGQKLRAFGQGDENGSGSTDKLILFPGWACRKYIQPQDATIQDSSPFNVELFVSGYASRSSGPGFGTRAGRTFLRIAKSYAALPKVIAEDLSRPASPSPEDLMDSLHLPPKPEEMTDEAELQALEEQMRRIEMDAESITTTESSASSYRSLGSSDTSTDLTNYSTGSFASSTDIQKFHSNLESRLHPFWSSSIAGRNVRVSVYAVDPKQLDFKSPMLGEPAADDDYASHRMPIASGDVQTGPDGSFQIKLILDWEKMCMHPTALHVAFGNPDQEHTLYITAELSPAPSRPPSPNAPVPYAVRAPRVPRNLAPTATNCITVPITHTTIRLISDIDDTIKLSGVLSGARAAFHNVFVKDLSDSIIPGMGDWYTDMWRRGVRFHYVSNSPFALLPVINEFLQLSHLPPGSIKLKSYAGRSLFNGILAAPAERKRAGIVDLLDSFPDARFFLVGDSGEQDMELYATLARDRPHQVLAIFIRDAHNADLVSPIEDPTGLKANAMLANTARRASQTLLAATGPLTPSALRRQPRSLSSSDVETPRQTYVPRQPKRTRSAVPMTTVDEGSDYFTSQTMADSPISESPRSEFPPSASANYPPNSCGRKAGFLDAEPRIPESRQSSTSTASSSSVRSSLARASSTASLRGAIPLTESERKQQELQLRVWRARTLIPDEIPLRVFREPNECVEAKQLLDQLGIGPRLI